MISKLYEYCNCYKYNDTILVECYPTYEQAKDKYVEHPYNYYTTQMICLNKLLPTFMKTFIINSKFHVPIIKKK